jgi:2',3'-cyclic-nucleotide 2'-phosphodiesterase (5'-nucleotidase family)
MRLSGFGGRMLWRTLGVAVVVLAVAVGGGWWLNRQVETPPNLPLRVVIAGDTAGWIVPCGCTANQSGGLLRRGTTIKRLREHADVILADVGGAPAGTSAYQRIKFEAILKGEMAIGLAAHNIGASEAALGTDYLRRVSNELAVPLVSANVRDGAGQLLAPALRIIDRDGQRVAFAGVLSRQFASTSRAMPCSKRSPLSAASTTPWSFWHICRRTSLFS